MTSHVPHTRGDGVQILRHALRCRWCFAATTGHEDASPLDMTHIPWCPVAALVDRWKREGNSGPVVSQYDTIARQLDEADERPN